MITHKTYKLKLMTDMFDIPSDRFEEFLIDLRQWHQFGGAFANLLNATAEAMAEPLPEEFMTMHWTDDGKHDGEVKVKFAKPDGPRRHGDHMRKGA